MQDLTAAAVWETAVTAIADGDDLDEDTLVPPIQKLLNRTEHTHVAVAPIVDQFTSVSNKADTAMSNVNPLWKKANSTPFVIHAGYSGGAWSMTFTGKHADVTVTLQTLSTGLVRFTLAGSTLLGGVAYKVTQTDNNLPVASLQAGGLVVDIVNGSNVHIDANFAALVFHSLT